MKLHVSIGGSQRMSLTGAALIYEGGESTFAAWHPAIQPENGPPLLGPGEPLTTDFLRALSSGLGTYVAPEILPSNVLVRTAELIVWWTRHQHRTLFFTGHNDACTGLNGKRYPIPPLVFKVSGGSLSVRALDQDERPTAKTALRTAPFWNVNEEGDVCLGTMRVPETSDVDSTVVWELGFFQSEFTHANGGARLTRFPGGFVALCRHLAGKRKPFPVEFLTDARETLQQFVERR
ncbi:MAG: PRTRC system protein B [Bryobacterales bacterium]|nr:PRTRC system protein B [Bryobacterales bacterium]